MSAGAMYFNMRPEVIVSVYCVWVLSLSLHYNSLSLCRFLEMRVMTAVEDYMC